MLSKKVLLLRIGGVVVACALRRTDFWNPTVYDSLQANTTRGSLLPCNY
jgi:hypothetical protein